MYNFNRDLIYFIKRDGTTENPYQNITESMTVLYEKAFLEEVPVQAFKVVAKIDNVTLSEVQKPEHVKASNQYYVNYKQGIVYFHSSRNNSLVTLTYRGQGVLLYPASRIYIDGEYGARDVVKTLKDLINEGASALDAIVQLNDVIDRANTALSEVDVAVVNSNDAVNRINQKISEVDTAEASRVSNENTRQTNESTRISNETKRQDAESLRISREDARIISENERLASEESRVEEENLRITAEIVRENSEADRVLEERFRVEAEDLRIENETERQDNEADRVDAENLRISEELARVNAESERKSNEELRESNEIARAEAEVIRESNEDARIVSENIRIEDEKIRISNENTRIENESGRLVNENTRAENENDRISNENERVSAESTRELSENSRISEEANRVVNENTRESNEILRVSAETDRANAESLRQSQESQRQTTFQNQISTLNNLEQDANELIAEMEIVKDEASQQVAEVESLLDNTSYIEEFNIDSTYKKNNIVSYNGSSYIAKQETIGNLPTNLVYWGVLSVRGVDGTGAVSTVNNISPDENGNVAISAEQIGAERVSRKGVANGYAGLDSNSKIPLVNIPDTLKQQVYVVLDESARLALTNVISGDKAFETSTKNSYIYDGTEWQTLAEADWENVSLEWINIVNKPSSTVESIDLAVSNSHAHTNIEILEKFSIVDGKLKYDGVDVGSVESVNGMTGAVTLTALSVGAYSKSEVDNIISNVDSDVDDKILNHANDMLTKHVQVLDSKPTTLDKKGVLFIVKGSEIETPESNVSADIYSKIDELRLAIESLSGEVVDGGLFPDGDEVEAVDGGLFTSLDDGEAIDGGLFTSQDDDEAVDGGTF